MIPKILHVTWFGPKEMKWKYEKEVREMYSDDFDIKVWTGESLDFVDDNDFVKFCKQEGKWVFVNDYYRIKILEKYGGVYIDTDMLPTRKLEDWMLEKELLMGYEFRNFITTGFCAVVTNSEFIKRMVDYYDSLLHPNFVPLSNLLATEVIYSIYPSIGVANKFKELPNGYLMNRRAFGLWKKSRGEQYFAHKHDSGWMRFEIQKKMLDFFSNFSKLTPAWVTTIMSGWQRHMTNTRYKELLKGTMQYKIENKSFLDELDFYNIVNSKMFVNITLDNCSKELKNTLKKIPNIKKINSHNEFFIKNIEYENINFDTTNKISMKYKTNYRAKFETDVNIINKNISKNKNSLLK